MFCDKCGAKLDDDAQFCPECGNKIFTGGGEVVTDTTKDSTTETVAVAEDTTPAARPAGNVVRSFDFKQNEYLIMLGPPYASIDSQVTVNGITVKMVQRRVSHLPFANHDGRIVLNCEYKISDIQEIVMKKVLSIGWIVYTGLCFIGLVSRFEFILLVCVLVGLFNLRKKKIYIRTKDGQKFLIPDEGEVGAAKIKDFIQTVKNFNPQVQANI